jgi:hypothetical protein
VSTARGLSLIAILVVTACAGDAGPPPSPLAAGFLSRPGFRWRRVATPNLRLYVRPHSYAARHADGIAGAAEEAGRRAYRLLEMPEEPAMFDVFFVADRAEMTRLTGRRERGTTFPEDRAAVLVASEHWRPFLRHELMHAASIRAWGRSPAADWVQEGLATDTEGVCGAQDIDTVAGWLVRNGRAIPLADLTTRFREQDDLTAYMLAGSLVRHLRTQYGIRAVHAAWSGDASALQRATGRTLAEIDAEWRRAVAARPATAVDWDAFRKNGCGWRP